MKVVQVQKAFIKNKKVLKKSFIRRSILLQCPLVDEEAHENLRVFSFVNSSSIRGETFSGYGPKQLCLLKLFLYF